jgi:FMN-dependent NADH-azoreductase
VRKDSRTNKLAQHALNKLQGNIEEINLDFEKIVPLYREQLELRDSLIKDKNYNHPMFEYAKQFANADIILMSAPYWDLSFPTILKTYIENINVNGITFSYSEKGYPVSLCNAKKLIYITTAGGPIISDDFGFGYIKSLAENFHGIKDLFWAPECHYYKGNFYIFTSVYSNKTNHRCISVYRADNPMGPFVDIADGCICPKD